MTLGQSVRNIGQAAGDVNFQFYDGQSSGFPVTPDRYTFTIFSDNGGQDPLVITLVFHNNRTFFWRGFFHTFVDKKQVPIPVIAKPLLVDLVLRARVSMPD